MSGRDELKAALAGLHVNQPLRLKGRAPVFAAPGESGAIPRAESPRGSNPSQGEKRAQDPNPPQDTCAATEQGSETADESARPIPATKQTQGHPQSRGTNPSQALNATPGFNPSHGTAHPADPPLGTSAARIARSSQPRLATAQDAAVLAGREVESGLVRGYTRLPNPLLMRLVSGELSKHEAQVLLLVARLTISFRREMAPISKSLIEKHTGIRGSAVLQTLSRLEGAGLIRRISGNERRPSQIGLVLEDGWDRPGSGPDPGVGGRERDIPGAIPPQGAFQPGPGDGNAPASPGIFGPTGKSNQKYKNSLSLAAQSEYLRSYFDQLKAPRKRESEWQAFQELAKHYRSEEIAEALKFVREGSVHSPMAYLGKAISEVLVEVERRRASAQAAEDLARAKAERQAREQEHLDQEARQWAAQKLAFAREYETDTLRREAIRNLCTGMPFRPESEAGCNFAIGRWWASLSTAEREVRLSR